MTVQKAIEREAGLILKKVYVSYYSTLLFNKFLWERDKDIPYNLCKTRCINKGTII
ncbi:Hypothetical protein IALB_0337 [Ignavibacterium album JCM 16511]|uniref:Uncharacterized protein n=1 Tax=Ignavibacterium album (strain DSM 19864 / JCM 16511 / NBRC 101810 / Mat9-16) TaxID=945713 RepID=I0AGE2_IGNAJ|nr:Hypothetical protein IALB_0337 [Ignavibacterium album JCM 16511]